MNKLSAEALSERVIRCIPERVRSLSGYVVPDSSDLIKLDAMENPYSWPTEIKQAWLQRLQSVALNRYPDPNATSLKQTLRQVMAIPASADLILGNGSDELLQLCILALSQPGSAVLAPEPGFAMYRLISQWAGVPYIGIPLTAEFAIDLEAMLAAIEKHQPSLIFIAFPNNPTGNLFSRSALETIIQAAPGLVLVDEAYAPFAEASFMQDLPDYPQLLVMRTLSKLGLAGIRLGFLVGSRHWLRELDKLRLPYNINVLSQASAEFALGHQDLFAQQSAQIRQDRTLLMDALQALPGCTAYPSRANFILFRTPPGQAVTLFEKLRTAGVLIKNLHGSHDLLADCLRVTVGQPQENAFFLKALQQSL